MYAFGLISCKNIPCLIPGIVWDFKKFKLVSLNIIFNDRYIKKIDDKNKQIVLTMG